MSPLNEYSRKDSHLHDWISAYISNLPHKLHFSLHKINLNGISPDSHQVATFKVDIGGCRRKFPTIHCIFSIPLRVVLMHIKLMALHMSPIELSLLLLCLSLSLINSEYCGHSFMSHTFHVIFLTQSLHCCSTFTCEQDGLEFQQLQLWSEFPSGNSDWTISPGPLYSLSEVLSFVYSAEVLSREFFKHCWIYYFLSSPYHSTSVITWTSPTLFNCLLEEELDPRKKFQLYFWPIPFPRTEVW